MDVYYQPITPFYRPAEKLINATNLLKAARIRCIDVRKILGKCGVTNITPLPGKGAVAGSYVSYYDGLKICNNSGLDHGPVQEVMKDAEETTDPGEIADTHAETATSPMRIRGRVIYRSKEFINTSHLLAVVGDRHVSRSLKGWEFLS